MQTKESCEGEGAGSLREQGGVRNSGRESARPSRDGTCSAKVLASDEVNVARHTVYTHITIRHYLQIVWYRH